MHRTDHVDLQNDPFKFPSVWRHLSLVVVGNSFGVIQSFARTGQVREPTVVSMGVKERPQCYFDVEINREPVGRIVFQLFSDICPKTSKNFLCLCTGEKRTSKTTGKKLCFKGSTFHRIVKNFMIQGGDFTEGNGRGGESIYGGYFEDENFILKHDRAFLLSMANRGKDTNGSQFFITTKMAAHLDGVHVVFGLVISGFEVIKKIEGLKTDSASRPYADVRVIDCGQLITKSANDVLRGKRKRATLDSADSSPSSSESPYSYSSEGSEVESRGKYRHHKRKKASKSKHSKKRRRGSKRRERHSETISSDRRSPAEEQEVKEDGDKEQTVRREKPVVRPEEIPPVPENRFLLRRDAPLLEENPNMSVPDPHSPRENLSAEQVNPLTSTDHLKPAVTKSGRKIKGRGTMRYHTPPGIKTGSESEEERGSSETPPHWKEEMQRIKTYQAPSVEKWSKGDRWDDRSDSPWSRSRSKEQSPDHGSDHSSPHHHHRKKSKRKKKNKKHKHSKRHKSSTHHPKESSLSEGERSQSLGGRSKRSSHAERRSRSLSSSRHSVRRDWSGSERKGRLSGSSRDSRSYSRSKSRSYSRSYSRSHRNFRSSSRSRSWTRSRSRSVSRSRSRSRTRSSSLSRSRSRTSSRSRSTSRSRYRGRSKSRRRHVSRPPRKGKTDSLKPKMAPLQATVPSIEPKAAPPSAPENVPVLPLSDSPPPSRWKPGQKPWKPSYVRIQEIKDKTTPPSTAQTGQLMNLALHKQLMSSGPTQSDKSSGVDALGRRTTRSSSLHRRSRSPSSSSRSRSRSRSRGRSRSTIHSSGQYDSRSSSYSRSDSYDSPRQGNTKRKSFELGKKHHHSSIKTYHKDTQHKMPSGSQEIMAMSYGESGANIQKGTIYNQNGSKGQKDVISATLSSSGRTHNPKPLLAEESKGMSAWECSIDVPTVPFISETRSSGAWDSDSDVDKPVLKQTMPGVKHMSDKEEGEATSESDGDYHVSPAEKPRKPHEQVSHGLTSPPLKSPIVKDRAEDQPEVEKHKSKKTKRKHKHKRRNSAKSGSQHSKRKTKRSKKKHQKLKETFHWQPPLEFGEEVEEDESVAQGRNTTQSRQNVLKDPHRRGTIPQPKPRVLGNEDQVERGHSSSQENSSAVATPLSIKDDDLMKRRRSKPSYRASPAQHLIPDKSDGKNSVDYPKHDPQEESQDDQMDICTPDHQTVPEIITEPTGHIVVEMTQKLTKSISPLKNPVKSPPVEEKHVNTPTSMVEHQGQNEEISQLSSNQIADQVVDAKWKPLKGITALQAASVVSTVLKTHRSSQISEAKTPGLKIEIKSKNRVRPGSLFDEVRKTARLNQRPRNQDSSSDERSLSEDDDGQGSHSRSPSKSRSASRNRSHSRGRSRSYTHSRSRSRSSSYSSRSYSRSSRRRYSRGRSRSRSGTYRSYRSHSRTYSRSHSRSRSYTPRRRSRSDSYDSYSSRSRSRSTCRRRRRGRSDSSDRHSSRTSSRRRSHSQSSRYS
ncbi:NK-tumor recognition protein isoform X3 [Sardina pilchardus]|uniref:NK-tumor recognition protein isoform X3 n=1 Tax=Sardina pilchardus TaxID=27697 RepID=UPI002E14F266